MQGRWIHGAGVAALMGLVRGSAGAHDNWLEVQPFFSPTPGKAKVYLWSGEAFRDAEPLLVRARDRYEELLLLSAQGSRNVTQEIREDQQPLAVLNAGPRSLG